MRLRPSTRVSYRSIIERHILPNLGTKRLDKLTVLDVEQLLARKANPPEPKPGKEGKEPARKAKPLSPRRVQMIRDVPRVALNAARRDRHVGWNVASLAEITPVIRTEIQPLTIEQATTLLETVRGDRLEAVVVLALATAAREGELLGLRWRDVDIETGRMSLRVQPQPIDDPELRKDGHRLQLVELKTARSRRVTELPDFAVAALRAHRERQQAERVPRHVKWAEHDLVFLTARGTPFDPSNFRKRWKAILRAAGLPPATRFYDLRHTAASVLLATGVGHRTIMEILGHSQIALTMNTYTHVLAPLRREAAAKLQGVFGGSGQSAGEETR